LTCSVEGASVTIEVFIAHGSKGTRVKIGDREEKFLVQTSFPANLIQSFEDAHDLPRLCTQA
jgi:hypothetical protein